MTEKKKRSRKPKVVKAPVEVVQEAPIAEVEPNLDEDPLEGVEVIPTPEPEFDIVFVPDDELDIVFTPDPEVFPEPEPEPAPKVVLKKDDPDMYGLTQTRFGRGKHTWRRRTRRLKGD